VAGTTANIIDITQTGALLHCHETAAFADAGYQGVHKQPEARGPKLYVAMRPGTRLQFDLKRKSAHLLDEVEHLKACARAKVEHPFRMLTQQFGSRRFGTAA
jgi:IS5 family transposase